MTYRTTPAIDLADPAEQRVQRMERALQDLDAMTREPHAQRRERSERLQLVLQQYEELRWSTLAMAR